MSDEIINEDRLLTNEDFEQLKVVRNNFLSSTDKYMLIEDLPQSIIVKITQFRDTVRNINTKFGTEWTRESHVQWPEAPTELMPRVLEPFDPPPGLFGDTTE